MSRYVCYIMAHWLLYIIDIVFSLCIWFYLSTASWFNVFVNGNAGDWSIFIGFLFFVVAAYIIDRYDLGDIPVSPLRY